MATALFFRRLAGASLLVVDTDGASDVDAVDESFCSTLDVAWESSFEAPSEILSLEDIFSVE